MQFHLPQGDYAALRKRILEVTKKNAFHPYVRLFVFLTTFIALFTAVVIKDAALPALQSPKEGPSGDRAWKDLQYITQLPHPWNSRQNDIVRDYILKQMKKVSSEYNDVVVEDDRFSMVLDNRKDLLIRITGGDNITVTYFEGLNVLVRIPGTSNVPGAILVSAHFDSVSTAYGATDDGMGTVTAMELVRYFAEHRTKRDIIFNLNNGEEDFLWGAKAFVNHPWSRDVIAFVNLEGAGAGGPAILFRSSNSAVAHAYSGVPYPRITQLGNDFFKSGLIRSETDYVVYEEMNGGFTPGLDFAFFRPRSLYHTPRDNIRHTSPESLQHMLSTGQITARNLANNVGKKNFVYGGQPVYFDFLGNGFAHIKMGVLWIWNLVLLLVCPWILGSAFYGRIKLHGKVMLQGFGVVIAAVLGSSVVVVIALYSLSKTSAPLLYAHPQVVLGFTLLLAFTTMYLITRLNYLYRPSIRKNTADAERVLTWELTVVWYIALFIAAIVSVVHKIGFLFFVPISFLGSFLASLITLLEPSAFAEPLLSNGDGSAGDAIEEPDETAPLLGDPEGSNRGSLDADEQRLNGLLAPSKDAGEAADWRNWLWLVRFAITVPIPALIQLELVAWTMLPALSQTTVEGTPASFVFLFTGFFAVVSLVNTIPFLLRLPFKSTMVLIVPVFVSMIIVVSSPVFNHFTPTAPFKAFYRSAYDLDTGNSTAYIYGMDPYLKTYMSFIPTAKATGHTCEDFLARGGRMCHYPIPNPSLPSSYGKDWFSVKTSLQDVPDDDEHFIAKVEIHTNNSRVCILEFDRSDPPEIAGIGGIRFYQSEGQGDDAELLKKDKCTVLRMFKRSWGEEPFEVLLKFKTDGPGNITVACLYDEWSPGGGVGVVPSLDEIWHNIPAWAGVVKFTTGLLQVRKQHKIF